MSVAGKVSLITGAAQGFGKAFSEILLRNGARVCVADINETKGEATRKELGEKHGNENVTFVKCDVTSQADYENAFLHTKSTFNGIDLVCNNAGISDESKWEDVIRIDLTGALRGTLLGIAHMSRENGGNGGTIINTASLAVCKMHVALSPRVERQVFAQTGALRGTLLGIAHMSRENGGNGGTIINTASLAGVATNHIAPTYTAAKHGVVAYTRSWAKNPKCGEWGLKFHALCPAFAETEIIQKQEGQLHDMDHVAKLVETFGIMSVDKVADAFMELVKSDANGQVLCLSQNFPNMYIEEQNIFSKM